ncbi:MAG: hypothetical protein IKY73_02670 [Bacteroidaceae bacterium]|nr:hypothetical protein [Bacteroidaceae bacterium]
MNTKMLMAVIGLLIGGMKMLHSSTANIDKSYFVISLYAMVVSLVCGFAVVYNGTTDTSYVSYIMSMWTWLGGAYAVCNIIKAVHGKLSITLLTNYLVAVCVVQCVFAIVIDNVPSAQNIVDTYINIGQDFDKSVNRLYSLGAHLDTAGMRFSLVLVLLAHLLINIQKTIYKKWIWLYLAAYAIIVVIGNMMARTTSVGMVISIAYMAIGSGVHKMLISAGARKLWLSIGTVALLVFPYIVYKYNTDVEFHNDMRFAFEGFFALFEEGHWEVGSNTQLKNMVVLPDNFKTWVIGDGYFNNPVWSDPYYIGEVTGGYYKGTDVGYLRFIFYMGLTGLLAFSVFMCKAAQMAVVRFREYRTMILLLLLVHFVVWLKVSSDCFVIFALFLCIPKEDNDEYNKLVTVNDENSL